MGNSGGRVWTTGPKIVANILPLIGPLVVGAMLAMTFPKEGFTARTVGLMLAFPVVGWLSVNFLGLAGNRGVRRAMETRLDRFRPRSKIARMFVGFAGPRYRSALDPHEEIGWLLVSEEGLELVGDATTVQLSRSDVAAVGKLANAHSWLGLGGWVVVDAVVEGKAVRALLEPRQAGTHWGNARLGRQLRNEMAHWLASGEVPGVLTRPVGSVTE